MGNIHLTIKDSVKDCDTPEVKAYLKVCEDKLNNIFDDEAIKKMVEMSTFGGGILLTNDNKIEMFSLKELQKCDREG